MAASVISRPGSEYGPCKEDCNHSDCAELRHMANLICNECNEPIGYEARFYQDEFGQAHARCLE